MPFRIKHNPYSGIDWLNTQRIKAVSHEHVFDATKVAKMYDRGIRFFAGVHYQPSVPRYPYSNFSDSFIDWNYCDVDVDRDLVYSDVVTARKCVPEEYYGTTTNFRQQGLIVAYTDNDVKKYTKLNRNLNVGETWNECCEDESAWDDVAENNLTASLTQHTKVQHGSITTFLSRKSVSEWTKMAEISFDGDGQTHNTDDFPRIPNAEHPIFANIGGNHFNVLGTLVGEPGWSILSSLNFRKSHTLYSINNLATIFPTSSSFYNGKLFGTLNHTTDIQYFRKMQDSCSWFKGYEIFNNGVGKNDNNAYHECFHTLLNEGRTVYCVAVTDWQNDTPGISDVDGGTNVLYVPDDYDTMTVDNKSKAGMDCYINGKFVASRFGTKHITDFSVDEVNGTATLKVSGQAASLSLVFNGNYVTVNNTNEMTVEIPNGTTNISGEAWFGDSNGDVWKSETKLADNADFLFTQAIIIEKTEKNDLSTEMVMFALDDKQ